VATTEDFRKFKWLSVSAPDSRNMVLFPRRLGGHFMRLERPFPVYMRSRPEAFPIWWSESPDMVFWGHRQFQDRAGCAADRDFARLARLRPRRQSRPGQGPAGLGAPRLAQDLLRRSHVAGPG
jgi:hypothetical protein